MTDTPVHALLMNYPDYESVFFVIVAAPSLISELLHILMLPDLEYSRDDPFLAEIFQVVRDSPYRASPADVSSVAVASKLRVTGAEMENMALYLRTFFRLLSSWVHGEKSERSRGASRIPPRRDPVVLRSRAVRTKLGSGPALRSLM